MLVCVGEMCIAETKCRMWSKVVSESYFLWFKFFFGVRASENILFFNFMRTLAKCVLPEHLVQLVGCHAAAVISERQTPLTGLLHYIYPDLFGGYARI